MKRDEILLKLEGIFQDILDNDGIKLDFSMSSDDLEEWDSLTHIQIVAEIQNHFNVKFTSKEILLWETIEDLVECIISKL